MNEEISKILYEMADILEIQGVEWKPQALRKAARNIETLQQDIEELYKKEGEAGVAKMTLYIGLQRHNKIDGREGQEESIRQAELPLLMDSYSKDFK